MEAWVEASAIGLAGLSWGCEGECEPGLAPRPLDAAFSPCFHVISVLSAPVYEDARHLELGPTLGTSS